VITALVVGGVLGLVTLAFNHNQRVTPSAQVPIASSATSVTVTAPAPLVTLSTSPVPTPTQPPFTFPPTQPTTATTRRPEPKIVLSKSSGPPGTQLTVSGSGFDAGETVEIRFSTRILAKPVADVRGAFLPTPVTIPADWPFRHMQVAITASGVSSAQHAEEPFEVE
jgi:hypothetical protein